MELVERAHKGEKGLFFEQREFELVDNGENVCHLMVMVTEPGKELDLTVITSPEHFNKGYATEGIKRLIEWAIEHKYQTVRITNLFGAIPITKIAIKLGFNKQYSNVWTKSILGPLQL